MAEKLHLLIVTRHHLFRESLAIALATADSRFIISTVDSTDAVLSGSLSVVPDVLLVDLNPPNQLTPRDTKRLADGVGTHFLVFGQPKKEEEIVEYLESGAADYRITQNESVSELGEAIWKVAREEVTYTPERVQVLFSRLRQLSAQKSSASAAGSCDLTRREIEILGHIDDGLSNQQIASQLHLSLHTVKNHVHRILDKLDVKNRREAVRYAHHQGWLKEGA